MNRSPEFSYTYTPTDISVPDAYSDFIDVEYSMRHSAYDTLRFAFRGLKKLQSSHGDQYHSTYTSEGQRKVLIARWKQEKDDFWQVVVNDEYTNDELGRTIVAREFTVPASINHIYLQSSVITRAHHQHRWNLSDDTTPIILARAGSDIALLAGKNFKSKVYFNHEDRGMIEVLKRRENAEALAMVLSGLSKASHEESYSYKRTNERYI